MTTSFARPSPTSSNSGERSVAFVPCKTKSRKFVNRASTVKFVTLV
jgi:hypothetical protein